MRRFLSVLLIATLAASVLGVAQHGSQIGSTSTEYVPEWTAFAPSGLYICYVDVASNNVGNDDAFYLHFSACTGQDVDTNDVKLNGGPGNLVTSSDPYFGDPFAGGAPVEGNLYYAETDGIPGYTSGDPVYWSTNAVLEATATSRDLRLHAGIHGGSVPAVVLSTDADFKEMGDQDTQLPTSTTLTALGAKASYQDNDGDGNYDAGESIFVSQDGSKPMIGDIRLRASFGQEIASGAAEYTSLGTIVDPGLALAEINKAYLQQHLFLYFGRVSDPNIAHVQVGDIAIKHPVAAYGTNVYTEANGQREDIDTYATSAADLVFFIDVNGDTKFSPYVDSVYLNRPASMGGNAAMTLTQGDVRISRGDPNLSGAQAVGTLVNGENDFQAYGNTGGTSGDWQFVRVDTSAGLASKLTVATDIKISGPNQDFQNGEGQGVYDTGNTVVTGSKRIVAPAILSRVTVDCDGTEQHDLCTSATTLATLTSNLYKTPSGAFDATKGVYWDGGSGNTGTVGVGDLRVYHPTLNVGAVISGEADIGTTLVDASAKIRQTDATVPDSGNLDGRIIIADQNTPGTMSTGDIVLRQAASLSSGSTASCNTATLDPDCGMTLFNDGSIRVTGADSTFDDDGEAIYDSPDAFVTKDDLRLSSVGTTYSALSTVAGTDSDVTQQFMESDDTLYLVHCPTTCSGSVGDRVYLPPGAIAIKPSAAPLAWNNGDVELTLTTALASMQIIRDEAGGGVLDDRYWMTFGADARPDAGDVRLTANAFGAAGLRVASGTGETKDTFVTVAATFAYLDLDTSNSFSVGDAVYLDRDGDGTIELGDVRLTPYSTFAAGTIVRIGDADAATPAKTPNPTWDVRYADLDYDGAVDADEPVYMQSAGGTKLRISDIRLGGSAAAGGSSGGGSGGGGGGGGGGGTTTTVTSTATATDTGTSTETNTATTTVGGTDGTGTGTGTGDIEEGKPTPGVGLVALAGLLSVAVFVVRRRL